MLRSINRDLPFATLLADAPGQVASDLAPCLSTVLLHALFENCIFLFSPRAFDHLWVEHFLPTMEALDVCAIDERLSNLLPILRLVSKSVN